MLQVCLRRLHALQEKRQACSLPSALDDCESVSGCRDRDYARVYSYDYCVLQWGANTFLFSHQFETHRNMIRQLENGRCKFRDFDIANSYPDTLAKQFIYTGSRSASVTVRTVPTPKYILAPPELPANVYTLPLCRNYD